MLMTQWGETVNADNVHPEYPRPQMVRDTWKNLNGLWEYAITDREQVTPPESYEGNILVPFPIESALSGVTRRVSASEMLWYRRKVEIQPSDERVLLHFGAVDWEATVWVNGNKIGTHRGGYDPFSFDITGALNNTAEQEIIVQVWDPTDEAFQPRGKQVNTPESIWYTPITGIWQTVWLESVPQSYIAELRLIPNIDNSTLQVSIKLGGAGGSYTIQAQAFDGEHLIAEVSDSAEATLTLNIENAKRWSPESPFLYDLTIKLLEGDLVIDRIGSYFGMRKVEILPDSGGALRIFLNNEPVFNYGLLDQGFFPDGLYTAPSDEALRYDIEMTKQLGFNTIRKHVKVEPARWYYWADKLGVLVWQDMPSSGENIRVGQPEMVRTEESAAQFKREYRHMVEALFNYPSIIVWVVFNEGWGQFDTVNVSTFAESLDSTRLINSVTGWNDMGVGHMHDIHAYPGPEMPPASPGRALVLGEFGGLGLSVEGHMWQSDFWGYRAYLDVPSLTSAYADLINALRPMISEQGLAAAIYTQTTDVETEANGMMTYDRAVTKMDVNTIRTLNESLYDVVIQVD
ncbi:MAG: glycoside hydrolase family 2 TIM barrel-domain containing protein [Aggregatilineales bacterium]